MKFFIVYLSCVLSLFTENVSASEAMDIALEMQSIKVEYIETTNRGIVYVNGCNHCQAPYYKFNLKPEITRKGQEISFEEFMSDYWNAKFPTLILDIKTQSVLHIVY